MNIFLIGYMASGKSTVGKVLASKLGYDFMDLDSYMERKEKLTIPELFAQKGEIYFRKKELQYLKELLQLQTPTVMALGGGTPCYGNAMQLIKESPNAQSIYLKVSLQELTQRLLKEKESRPVISHLESEEVLLDFVRKHLFERQHYYNQCDIILDSTGKSIEDIVQGIILKLF